MGNTPSKNAHTSISMTPDVGAGSSSSAGSSLQTSEDGGLDDPICSGSSSSSRNLRSSAYNNDHLGYEKQGPEVNSPLNLQYELSRSSSSLEENLPYAYYPSPSTPKLVPSSAAPTSRNDRNKTTQSVPVPLRRRPSSFTTPRRSSSILSTSSSSSQQSIVVSAVHVLPVVATCPATTASSSQTPTPTKTPTLTPTPTHLYAVSATNPNPPLSFAQTVAAPQASFSSATPTDPFQSTQQQTTQKWTKPALTIATNDPVSSPSAASRHPSSNYSPTCNRLDKSSAPLTPSQPLAYPTHQDDFYAMTPVGGLQTTVALSSSLSSVGTSFSSSLSSFSQSSQSSQSSQQNSPIKTPTFEEYPSNSFVVDEDHPSAKKSTRVPSPGSHFPANTIVTKANLPTAAHTLTTALGTNVDIPGAATATQQLSTTPKAQHPRSQQRSYTSVKHASPSTSPSSATKSKPKQHAVDVNELIDRLLNAGLSSSKRLCISNNEIIGICRAARSIFLSQPTLLELGTPVQVVGDIHGQYGDLRRVFQLCGMPPESNYLFLGDYVDRGKQSIETMLLLLCLKIRYPENVFLLRGNHECANVTRIYGFYDECKRRASVKVWKTFVDTFNTLPIAATIGRKIFCVHGGLSPFLNSLDDIRNIQRPTDIPEMGLLSDLLWSDPDSTVEEWHPNDRGVSYCFGKHIVESFCAKFGFDLVARGHMVVEDGYEFFCRRQLVTVFSAPNYCGDFGNWAAVMTVGKDLLCRFELLQPLDTNGVRRELKNGRKTNVKTLSPIKKKDLITQISLKG